MCLLIEVLRRSLVFLRRSARSNVVTLNRLILSVLEALTGQLGQFVSDRLRQVPRHPMSVLRTKLCIRATVSNGQTGQRLRFINGRRNASTRRTRIANGTTNALQRCRRQRALLRCLTHPIVKDASLKESALISGSVVYVLTDRACREGLTSTLLRRPLRIASRRTMSRRSIRDALVVNCGRVALVLLRVFPALCLRQRRGRASPGSEPPLTKVVSPRIAVTRSTTCRNGGANRSTYRGGGQRACRGLVWSVWMLRGHGFVGC